VSVGRDAMDSDSNVAFLRGLTEARLSRRRLLRGAAAGALGLSVAGVLDACGVSGSKGTGAEADFDWKGWWAKQEKQGTLDWANWPLYIDTSHGKHPSLDLFTKQTGIEVNYKPVIQDNASFFAQIRPVLENEQSIGYDLIVITDGWELTQLIDNRWLIPLDKSRMPNFFKYAGPSVVDPSFDPGNEHTVTWQSGLTGIAYDPRMTGREITSVKDLFDPAFKGKVGMMSDNTEIGAVGMLAIGIEDQPNSTPDDWRKAADFLKKQRDDGIVRQYYDQSYIKALQDGDTWISQAWSGDVFQSQNSGFPNLRFVVPEEGAMIWHDNCMIPLHAEHPVDAMEWIDFYYQPEIQAMIEDWVWYLCPVPDAQGVIATKLDDPTVAKSPLVFPPPSMETRFREYYTFTSVQDHEEYTSIFDPIVQS
jgi:spermidine/putrescine transport system substrate-binding protein